jgi:hypothetical protein
MGFRTGLIVGGAVGYVLGARAGRERYEEIAGAWQKFLGNERVSTFTEKGRAAADLTAQRVRGGVEQTLHSASDKVRGAVEGIGHRRDDEDE